MVTFVSRLGFSAIVGVSLLFSARPSFADQLDDDAKKAEELFNEAREAISRDDYKAACPKFEESLKLVRRAGTMFNLAQCEEHEGRLVTAMRYYKEGIVVLEPGDPRLGPSKQRLSAVEPRIPRLTIQPAADLPKDSRVTLDGKEVEGLSMEILVNPGEHTLAVFAPKRVENKLVVKLEEGERKEVGVSAGAVVVEPPRPPPPPVVEQLGKRRIVGLVSLGVGGLGFVGAAVTGGQSAGDTALAPTFLEGTTEGMEVSRQEIFGPVLPLIPFSDLDQVLARIGAGPKPLALYVFGGRALADRVVGQTASGSVGVNLTLLTFSHPNLPFGGIGNSGLGAAHGHEGFRAFSHERPVLTNRFLPMPMLFPPYGPRVRRLAETLLRLVR